MEATLEHTDTVLVDVGAQHFVTKVCSTRTRTRSQAANQPHSQARVWTEQTIDEARDYNTRRIKAVQENIAQIEQMIQRKRALLNGTALTLQQKMQHTGQR